MKRLDKRKDRVEIGTDQLASAFHVVEELNSHKNEAGDKNSLQVVGWYHSHPHITVFPSEVDITTHHQYQSQLSPFWLGLIFGVFNFDETTFTNKFQLIGFQSVETMQNSRTVLKHAIIPIVIKPRRSPAVDEWQLKKIAELIDLLLDEEKEAFFMNQAENGGTPAGNQYNACVYNKAVAKITTLLGAPMMDAMNTSKEKADWVAKKV